MYSQNQKKKRNEGRADYNDYSYCFIFLCSTPLTYDYTPPIKKSWVTYTRSLNCMRRLPRQLSGRKRKKERRSATLPPTNQQENVLTCAGRYGSSSIGRAELTRIDVGELAIDDAVKLRVASLRRGFAEQRRREELEYPPDNGGITSVE